MQPSLAVDQIRIRHLLLRGPLGRSSSVEAGLSNADWPSTAPGETLILRRLRVVGSGLAIGALAASQARGLAARAVDGDDPRAGDAEGVRFRSRGHLLACLVADLLAGRAASRWYWRTFADLFALPPVVAAARALAREPLLLPAVGARLRRTALWHGFWEAISPDDSREVLAAVWRETGWPALGASTASVAVSPSFHADASLIPWSAGELPPLRDGLAPEDPRVRLAAVVVLWRRAPQILARAEGRAALDGLALELTGRAGPEPSIAAAAAPTPPKADRGRPRLPGTRRPTEVAETGQPSRPNEAYLPTPRSAPKSAPTRLSDNGSTEGPAGSPLSSTVAPQAPELRVPHSAARAGPTAESGAASPERGIPRERSRAMRPPHQRDPQGLHREDSGVVPSQRDGDEGASPKNPDEHRLVTARGGLFYLLNLLNLPAAQELLADQPLHGLAAGWIWLYQLGRALGCEPDEPLASFLAAEAGLTDRFALEDLAPAPDLPMLLRLGTARYGEAVFNGELCDLPALVVTTLSHLDLHFRMEDVRVRVRRVALDVNPGWLPWLGRVVTFHYRGAPELAAWGRP